MRYLTVSILSDKWRVYSASDAEFTATGNDGIAGFTEPERRCIYLNTKHMSRSLVEHELTHAYFSYLCLDNATINQESMEEILCDFLPKYAPVILKQAKQLIKKL